MSSKEFLRSAVAFVAAVMLLMASAIAVEGLVSPGNDGEADDEALLQELPEDDGEPERLVELYLKQDGEHAAYISGYEDGSFKPNGNITRAEAASMLFGLLGEKPEERVEFVDVSESAWYSDAIGLLAAGGIIGSEDGAIRPSEPITRGEFAAMMSRFFPEKSAEECYFADVDEEHEYYKHIAKAVSNGWINGYEDDSFKPDNNITRAEAVTILNRVLLREADEGYLQGIILPLFSDLAPDHWAYGDVMEAALGHVAVKSGADESEENGAGEDGDADTEDANGAEPDEENGADTEKEDGAEPNGENIADADEESGGTLTEVWSNVDTTPLRREAGQLFVGQELYYISEETGLPVTNDTVGSLYFGADGRYTSGDTEIDGFVKQTLATICTAEMTQEEKLRAAYDYTRDSFKYLRRNYYDRGYTEWVLEEARIMFQTGRGNCYCYAGVFYYLSRQLGYDSRIISGGVGWSERQHGWVEIDEDGVEYIYDTELEMSYREKGNYQYDFYRMAYADVPWPYKK